MNKRERIERTIAGEPADRAPVACWRHFPGDDQRAADFAQAVVSYQQQYDWDIAVAAPANSYLVTDYGAFDEWQGAVDGTRNFAKRAITRSLDWTNLRPLDPARGSLGRVLDGVRSAAETISEAVPFLVMIYSSLAQAADLSGDSTLIRHMRTQPERLHTGLNTLTETTLRWIDALRRLPLGGVIYVIRHADYGQCSDEEYATFGLPYDRKILDALPSKFWLNIVQIGGELPMFKFAGAFKAQAINWRDRDGEPTLALGKTLFNGAVCGGVSAHDLTYGTPNLIRDSVRDSLVQMNSRRLIVTPGSLSAVTTPLSHLRALREAVEWKA